MTFHEKLYRINTVALEVIFEALEKIGYEDGTEAQLERTSCLLRSIIEDCRLPDEMFETWLESTEVQQLLEDAGDVETEENTEEGSDNEP